MRLNKRDKVFEKARMHLQQELDLVSLIQQLRFFQAAATEIIPSDRIRALKDETMKLNVSNTGSKEKAAIYNIDLPKTNKKR